MSLRHAVDVGAPILVVLGLTIGLSGQSNDGWMGTWKVNVAKSTYSPGPPPKSATHKWEPSGSGGFKHSIDTVDDQGQSTHSEVVAKFDGKDYAVQGGQAKTTRAYKRIDDRMFEATGKADGKATVTIREALAADGKTKTATISGKNAQGQTVNNAIVFEKQ